MTINNSTNSEKENNMKTLIDLSTLNFKRKPAFTLAEVLITLGIIGVVAAITIPNLITHYQKKQTVTKNRLHLEPVNILRNIGSHISRLINSAKPRKIAVMLLIL